MASDMQITTGIRSILSHPTIYSMFQYLMGARQGWTSFVNNYLKPKNGDVILDIGCGPADILEFLPRVDYWGFDISDQYIAKARVKYGTRGKFHTKHLSVEDLNNLPQFDLVIGCGLLHHVNDQTGREIFSLAHEALKPGGRFVTIDPCFTPDQNLVSRFLISKDRGQHVRTQEAYKNLADGIFSELDVSIKHKLWIPYTHCIMECTK